VTHDDRGARPTPGPAAAGPAVTEIGLVLAAGAATRFGSPKQLAQFAGAPLVTWPVRALREAGLERIIVVLGAHAEHIAPLLSEVEVEVEAEVEVVVAENWSEGLSASLRAGVCAAAGHGAKRVIVTLGDQPALHPRAITTVRDASRGGAPIARAAYAGIPGHPVALAAETFAAVSRLHGDAGARRLHGFATVDVACDGLGSPADIDTPEDLRRAQTSG
jgi:CTP:molybdopterin cytidylyltransferase MocA